MKDHKGIHYLNSLTSRGINPSLDNVNQFLLATKLPKKNYFKITVAGTNGKGSTVGYLSKIFTGLGYKTGAIFSPHVLRVNERITLNGEEISDKELDTLLLEIKSMQGKTALSITYFEALFFASLLYFDKQEIDIAVLEVGLGGRFDAINSLHQDISIITSISIDHTQFLGNSLEEIAAEKFAIVKEGSTVVANLEQENLRQLLIKHSDKNKAVCLLNDKDFELHQGQYVLKNPFHVQIKTIKKNTSSNKQWGNIALAITAVLLFKVFFEKKSATDSLGSALLKAIPHDTHLHEGFETILLAIKEFIPPYRFQKISDSPEVYLDVAHNEESFNTLFETVEETLQEKKKALIAAFSSDKDWKPFVERALKVFDVCIFSEYLYERTEKVNAIKTFVSSLNFPHEVYFCRTIIEAKEIYLNLPEYPALVVTGSFYTIQDYLQSEKLGS
ncbi:MAG: hypothetical protein HQK84_01895 [Nitrospinae bacterium]|nr:hypothetical protein [Nitrospinota bacterium]